MSFMFNIAFKVSFWLILIPNIYPPGIGDPISVKKAWKIHIFGNRLQYLLTG